MVSSNSFYTQSLLLNCVEQLSVLWVIGLKKVSKFDLFQNYQSQNLNFYKFLKSLFRMNSMQPFYPILIPNIPYVKENQNHLTWFHGPLLKNGLMIILYEGTMNIRSFSLFIMASLLRYLMNNLYFFVILYF